MHKILVSTNDLEIGGVQKSLVDFLNHLVTSGHEVDLLVWKSGILRGRIPPNVQVIEFSYAKTWKNIIEERDHIKKVQFLSEYLKFIFFAKLRKKAWLFFPKMKQQYDVAISFIHNGYPRFYAIDSVTAHRKLLWYHHGSYDSTGLQYDLDQKYFGKYDALVTVSNANKLMLEAYFPLFTTKIKVVPNLLNAPEILQLSNEKVSDFKKEQGIFTFVTVSRFSEEKGIDFAIDIATELKNNGLSFKWYFIGDGDTFYDIKNLIKQKNMQEHCILLGSKENPYPYIQNADLYLQTSYVESQSITIYEALILKKLIVTSDLPALREALREGDLGVLSKPEVSAFVENIIHLVQNPSAQRKLLKSVAEYEFSNELAEEAIKTLLQ